MASKKNTQTSESSTNERVTVEVLDDRTLVHVGNLGELTQFKEDPTDEPRMSAAEMARRLDRDPKYVREVARRIKHDKFQPFLKSSKTTDGKRGFQELWFNEGEALYLVMHLRGPKPDDLKWEMIHVYRLAMRGLLPQHGVDSALLAEMRQTIEEHREQREEVKAIRFENTQLKTKMAALERRVAEDVGKVSTEFVKEYIAEPFVRIALLRASKDDRPIDHSKKIRSHLRAVNNEVRNLVGHNGKGSAWTNYPRDVKLIEILKNVIKFKLDDAVNKATEEVRRKAEESARTQAETRLKQLGLFDRQRVN